MITMTPAAYDEQGYGYYAPNETVLRRFVELLQRQEAKGKGRSVSLARLWREAGGAMAVPVPGEESDNDDEAQ